jgi:ribonuclease HII
LFLDNNMKLPSTALVRRSRRLQALAAEINPVDNKQPPKKCQSVRVRIFRKNSSAVEKKPASITDNDTPTMDCLPRKREEKLRGKYTYVLGVDEAGRGPLAGPVVAAAVLIPENIAGIVDSKKITNEDAREELYSKIVSSPGVRWAVAVQDAACIDEINILQATLRGMACAVHAVMKQTPDDCKEEVSTEHNGCYVVCGENNDKAESVALCDRNALPSEAVYALIDGNKVPDNLLCEAESMVKGDGREYSIAAASILAKVTRDRLMHAYHELYPEYNLKQHKGYPTAAHMAAVRQHGASAIHRRTFAPLKHMTFDDKGRIIVDE